VRRYERAAFDFPGHHLPHYARMARSRPNLSASK
jgi:hypothetical protein